MYSCYYLVKAKSMLKNVFTLNDNVKFSKIKVHMYYCEEKTRIQH